MGRSMKIPPSVRCFFFFSGQRSVPVGARVADAVLTELEAGIKGSGLSGACSGKQLLRTWGRQLLCSQVMHPQELSLKADFLPFIRFGLCAQAQGLRSFSCPRFCVFLT